MPAAAGDGQCEVVLVGCGAPKRGMGWYHAEQLMKDKCPSAKLCFIVEPWFLGGGKLFSVGPFLFVDSGTYLVAHSPCPRSMLLINY